MSTQNLSAAQAAQVKNRDDNGKWKQKTHGDVEDGMAVLGVEQRPGEVAAHPGDGTVMPTDAAEALTTPEERERLEKWYSAMSRHHGTQAGHAMSELPYTEDLDWQDPDFAHEMARHDGHAARAMAYRLPPNATRAAVDPQGNITTVYDRDGEGRAISGVQMNLIGEINPAWVDHGETAARDDGATVLNLDSVRGHDGTPPEPAEVPEPQQRITKRRLRLGERPNVGDKVYLDALDHEDDPLVTSRHGEATAVALDGESQLLDPEGNSWMLSTTHIRDGNVYTNDQSIAIDPEHAPV